MQLGIAHQYINILMCRVISLTIKYNNLTIT